MVTFKNILVPVDFGEPSDNAVRIAVDLAKQFRASLTLVHTWEIPAYVYAGVEVAAVDLYHPMRDVAQRQLDDALAKVKKDVPDAKAVLACGTPWREILAAIERVRPDLVVMGTHGRRGITRALLGSVTEKIVRTSPAPVLTVGAERDRATASAVEAAALAR
jgi:nucleotide-binding universal stress UspA family protein